MKANGKQTATKLTRSKIGTQVMVRVVIKYGKKRLHQVANLPKLNGARFEAIDVTIITCSL